VPLFTPKGIKKLEEHLPSKRTFKPQSSFAGLCTVSPMAKTFDDSKSIPRQFNKESIRDFIYTAGSRVPKDEQAHTMRVRRFSGNRDSFEAGVGFIEKKGSFDKNFSRKKSLDYLNLNLINKSRDLITMKFSPQHKNSARHDFLGAMSALRIPDE